MSKKHEHHKDDECERKCEEGACDCGGGDCKCGCGGGGCGCKDCGCGCHFQRRFQTKEEQIEHLEMYLKDLKLEVQAVEERLSDLRK